MEIRNQKRRKKKPKKTRGGSIPLPVVYLLNSKPREQACEIVRRGPGSNTTKTSFNGIDNPEDARQAAETLLSIENTKKGEVWTITFNYAAVKEIREGDLVTYQGTTFVVFSISDELQVHGVVNGKLRITCEGTQITMGKLIMPLVYLSVFDSRSSELTQFDGGVVA
jgi:hypothetical protein